MRNRTSDLRIALPLSHKDSSVSEVYYKVQVTRVLHTAYCILHTFRITSIYIQKYHAIDIADPSSMQDACHMNFVIDLA